MNISRRHFTRAVVAAAAPMILPSRILFGAETPSNKVVTAHIGVGGQGGGDLGGCLRVPSCQPVAACDAFLSRAKAAAGRMGAGAMATQDFREVLARGDIDAVVISTPDHWHVPIALAAVRAGKDVYVQKPLGLSIAQNLALREAVHRYGAIFQYGTQQRSFNRQCGQAAEIVRNGGIGRLKEIHVLCPNGATGGNPEPQPVPEDLDYDMWLGPAPVRPYTHDRVIGQGRWHIRDYSLGFIAGWGAHPLDVADWGHPHIPVEIEGTGRISPTGLFDTMVDYDIHGRYADGVLFTLKASGTNDTRFVGDEGWVAAGRSSFSAEPKSLLSRPTAPGEVRLLQGPDHYANFIECVRNRRTPASDIDSAVRSDTVSHLCDIAMRTGRKIRWAEEFQTITDDVTAARMMKCPMRGPWHL